MKLSAVLAAFQPSASPRETSADQCSTPFSHSAFCASTSAMMTNSQRKLCDPANSIRSEVNLAASTLCFWKLEESIIKNSASNTPTQSNHAKSTPDCRSEERRVGKECR